MVLISCSTVFTVMDYRTKTIVNTSVIMLLKNTQTSSLCNLTVGPLTKGYKHNKYNL